MKKTLFIIVIIFLTLSNLYSIVPFYYGAKSLSMGFSSSAYNFDINSIFLNPALLSEIKIPLTGYQFESGNFAYKNFFTNLSELSQSDLQNYSSLDAASRREISEKLKSIFDSKYGMYGFKANIPGFIVKRYGFSVSFYNLTVINPVETDIFDMNGILESDEIDNLKFKILGLNYRKYSLAYGVDFSKNISIGVTVHYLDGKIGVYEKPVTDIFFQENITESDYSKSGWKDPEEKFGTFVADISLSSNLGNFIKLGIIVKNISDPKIKTSSEELRIKERVIISAAFRPDNRFGIYFDMDLKKQNLIFNSSEIQPVSLGLEKIFFGGKFTIRGGVLSDLTEHYLFGKKSNILYGLGLGFNTGNLIIDAGMGLGNDGKLRSIAVSGFYMIR